MAVSIDWATKVINVPQADLTFVGGTLYEHDTNAFRLELKALEASAAGMPFDDTHRHNTEVVISSVVYARTLEIINGYTVTYEDGQYAVNLKGTNNNILDVVNRNQVSIGSNNSAGLVSPGFTAGDREVLEYVKYQDQKVFINTENVAVGDGSARSPFNSIGAGLDFAEAQGIRTLAFLADATLDRNLKNFSVEGLGQALLDIDGNDTTGSVFRDIRVRGASTATNFWSVIVGGFDDGTAGLFGGYIDVNWVGTATMAAGGLTIFTNVAPAPVPGLPAVFQMPSGAFHRSSVQNCTADIILSGFDFALHELDISMNGGTVTIDSSCTAGSIVVRGVGKIVDNSAGTAVDVTGLIDLGAIAQAVWDHTQ